MKYLKKLLFFGFIFFNLFTSSFVLAKTNQPVLIKVKISGTSNFWKNSDFRTLNRFLNGKYKAIINVEPSTASLIAELPQNELNQLKILINQSNLEITVLKNFKNAPYYRNWESLLPLLKEIADSYDFVDLYILGYTLEGYPIPAIYINKNPTGFKPLIRTTGSHHGDEQISVEMVLTQIQNLLEKEENFDLLDRYAFLFIPIVNPEGFVNDQRYTSDGIDLNRDYGIGWKSNQSQYPYSHPETRMQINLAEKFPPVFSIDYHTTATVVNSCYDYGILEYPEASIVLDIGSIYSNTLTDYDTIIGTDWYIAYGTSQDSLFDTIGSYAYTVETLDNAETYIELVNSHANALFTVLRTVSDNIYCNKVIDAQSGEPIQAVIRFYPYNHPVYTNVQGVFCKIINNTAMNSLQISSPFYETQTITIDPTHIENENNNPIELAPKNDNTNYIFRLVSTGEDKWKECDTDINVNTTLPENILGESDGNAYSVYAENAFITLDIGFAASVTDSTDLEIILNNEAGDYKLFLSKNKFDGWVEYPLELHGSALINIDPTLIAWFRYIKIQNIGLEPVSIDAIKILDEQSEIDDDNDGFSVQNDCDDNNADVFPGNDEICNGIDENCNGFIDENLGINPDNTQLEFGFVCTDATKPTNNDNNDVIDDSTDSTDSTDVTDDVNGSQNDDGCSCSSDSNTTGNTYLMMFLFLMIVFYKRQFLRTK